MDYDLMISELYQTQHECYMLAMALNNVVELVPVYEYPLKPSGAGEALLIQQVTDALVNANITPSYEGLLESAWDLVVKFTRKLGEYFKKLCTWISEHIKKWFSKSRVAKLNEHRSFIVKHRAVYDKYMNHFTISQEVAQPSGGPTITPVNVTRLTGINLTVNPSNNTGHEYDGSEPHPSFASLTARYICTDLVLDSIQDIAAHQFTRLINLSAVDVVDIFQAQHRSDIASKIQSLQNDINELANGVATLQSTVDDLNDHQLEYTSIDGGWDTARHVDVAVNKYHSLQRKWNEVNDRLAGVGTRLSSKSFSSIRITEYRQTLHGQARIDFNTFMGSYVRTCITFMNVLRQIHGVLNSLSTDMTVVFGAVELAAIRLKQIINSLRQNQPRSGQHTFQPHH